MGLSKSKIKVMPLSAVDTNDPYYYVGNVKKKWVQGNIKYIRSGSGKQIWRDNSTYLGDFTDDTMNGTGTITYPDGSIYVGMWKMMLDTVRENLLELMVYHMMVNGNLMNNTAMVNLHIQMAIIMLVRFH